MYAYICMYHIHDLVDEVAVVGAFDLELDGHRDLPTPSPSDFGLFRAGHWAISGRIGLFREGCGAFSGKILGYFGRTWLTRWRS